MKFNLAIRKEAVLGRDAIDPMKIDHAGAHLDHMLRQTRLHHVQLSLMADIKANASMTMAALMLTFSAPFVVREQFHAAVMVLMCFCLLTILLATFATMPRTPLRVKKRSLSDCLAEPGSNLLFFGSFVAMDYEQFERAMEEMMNDPSRTYEAMVREVYTLGLYLAYKKHRFLRLAYFAFTAGLFASGLTLLLVNIRG